MSGDDTAYLIYLMVLLAFVGGFMWTMNLRSLGRHLKQLLAWAGIFLLLILAYSQKDVLMRQLSPGHGVMAADGKTISLARAASGGFEAVLKVNGQDIRFLVDTGATDVVLSRADAARVGLSVQTLNFGGTATTANGVVRTAAVTLDEVAFAGLVDRDIPASVNGGELSFSLLGMSYLNRFERIEISGDSMLLVR